MQPTARAWRHVRPAWRLNPQGAGLEGWAGPKSKTPAPEGRDFRGRRSLGRAKSRGKGRDGPSGAESGRGLGRGTRTMCDL